MNSNDKKIIDLIQINFAQKLSQQEINHFKVFKNAANTFIKEIHSALAKTENLKRGASLTDEVGALYNIMRNGLYLSQIITAQHKMENALDDFLGRETFMAIIRQDGTPIFFNSENVGSVVYQYGTENRGRVNIDSSKFINEKTKMFDFAEDLKQDVKRKIYLSVQNKAAVYQLALQRFKKNSTDKKHVMRYTNDYQHTYYSRSSPSRIPYWTGSGGKSLKISHGGMIAEAYMEAVLADDDDVNVTKVGLQYAIMNLYQNYMQKDSIPAAVKADLQLRGSNIQIAVKEGKFSSARIGQFYQLAQNVLRMEKNLSVQNFKLILPKLLYTSSSKTGGGYTKAQNTIINKINQAGIIYASKKIKEKNGKKITSITLKV